MSSSKPTIPVLAGLTAAGKSSLALSLAERFPLEIITADAMQVYQGMDIGTAKPTELEQARVPHHLIDVVSPAESFSVAQWTRQAESCIHSVLERNKIPLVVGGTGFYIQALQHGLPTVPAADKQVQAPLWQRFDNEGIEPLIKEVMALAPADAERCQRNPRRIIRTLEVITRTGKAPSQFPFTVPQFTVQVVAIAPKLEHLQPRIVARVEAMLAAGLMAEVAGLLERYPQQPTALQAIGYKEIVAHLRGESTIEDAIAAIKQGTLHYAKRQRTWFKKVKGITMVESVLEAEKMLEQWLKNHSTDL